MGRSTTNLSGNNMEEQGQSIPAMHLSERIIYLSGEVTEQLITQVVAGMIALANMDKTEPITLVISTYGGSIDEMFCLYDVMKYIPCPVYTVGLGKIMSAGVLLLASGKKGHRLIGRHARLMVHPVSGNSAGTVFEVINETKEHVRQHNLTQDLLVRETKMSTPQVEKLMKSGYDNYIFAEDAVKFGIVDKIIGADEK